VSYVCSRHPEWKKEGKKPEKKGERGEAGRLACLEYLHIEWPGKRRKKGENTHRKKKKKGKKGR